MATLYLLGTGASISDPHRTTTMLAFESHDSLIVVDCGGDVIQRLMMVGIPYQELHRIDSLILTHRHMDHVCGFPLFMQKIWLAQRSRPIPVYGIQSALEQAAKLFDGFNTENWAGIPPIEWHEVPLEENSLVLEDNNWRITATPGTHSAPVTALRVEDKQDGGIVTYSCDTQPSPNIVALAQGADILIHEATGEGHNHTSALEAAHIAKEAGVKQLLLVHLPPSEMLTDEMMAEAREVFPQMEKGTELGRYAF